MQQRKKRLTVLFAGMIAAHPHQGGATWAVLQYLLGLRDLGHEIIFVEPIEEKALLSQHASLENSENARYFLETIRQFGLEEHAALLLNQTQRTVGLPYADLLEKTRCADLFLNVSGMLQDTALFEKIPRRVYLDLDPAFVQLWEIACNIDMRFSNHTDFVTIGLGIGQPGCSVPTDGRAWHTTLQPVVLEYWPVGQSLSRHALTTVANWRGYGSIEYEGHRYGQKVHSWREFFKLPRMTTEKFALALAIHPDEKNDVQALRENNWELLDPMESAGTPARYRRFIQGSKAEFGIAKSGYVVSQCGWFSDRSACYLASGRPVLAQETGFSRYLPVGEGLFPFTTIDDVLGAIEELNRDYPRHCRAARALAERFFDSRRVLSQLLSTLGVLP